MIIKFKRTNMKKLISIGLLIAFLVVGYVYFFVYNKSHPDYANQKPDFELRAETLYNDFINNAESKKYLGKVILIKGMVSSIENTDSSAVISINFEEGMFGEQGIRCTMLSPYILIKPGTEITIKGVCSGYNKTDVLLENCSTITK